MTGLEIVGRLRRPPDGLCPFYPGRDLPQVIELLRLGFGDELAARDQQWLTELSALAAAGPLLSVLALVVPRSLSGLTGFVWYEGGQLVANASLLRAADDTVVVANVVTDPEHRRRGIARQLMWAILDAARDRGAATVQLQVRHDNAAAQRLYAALGFKRSSARTLLRLATGSEVRRLDDPAGGTTVTTWRASDVPSARRLLDRAGAPDALAVPGLARQDLACAGWRGRWDDWLRSRRTFRWAAMNDGEWCGLAVARACTDTGPHQLEIVVDPAWYGRVEGRLVDLALDTLRHVAPLAVEADLDARQEAAIAALKGAGCARVRTLELYSLAL